MEPFDLRVQDRTVQKVEVEYKSDEIMQQSSLSSTSKLQPKNDENQSYK
jgi:hypothetical protein